MIGVGSKMGVSVSGRNGPVHVGIMGILVCSCVESRMVLVRVIV